LEELRCWEQVGHPQCWVALQVAAVEEQLGLLELGRGPGQHLVVASEILVSMAPDSKVVTQADQVGSRMGFAELAFGGLAVR